MKWGGMETAVSFGGGKISVLYLSSSSGPGGAERMLCSLAASLDRTRFRPIVALFRAGWLQEQCENLGIETHIFPSGGFLQSEWVKTCIRLVRREKVAIIHAHEFDANVHGTLAAFLARTPIVATIHGKHYYWTALRRRLAGCPQRWRPSGRQGSNGTTDDTGSIIF